MTEMDTGTLEVLLGALAGLVSLIVAVGSYLLRRLQRLEREAEARHAEQIESVRQENDRLRARVADLEEKAKRVPELERQIGVITRELEDLQAWKKTAQATLDARERRIKELEKENKRLEEEGRTLREENERLKTEKGVYERALVLLGMRLQDGTAESEEETRKAPSDGKQDEAKEKSAEAQREKAKEA